ncbi:hypothetical protein [Pseudonocardia hydrocarbonoxydans]|uniref:hypothetical protein n=1 Tax=Pseudonocardia hydrocarbonoxydans TaxID=76726 RepID=UPI0031D26146
MASSWSLNWPSSGLVRRQIGCRSVDDNVEFFDTPISNGDRTFLVRTKRGFIIENDRRTDPRKRHHEALARRGRTAMPEGEFLASS